MKFSVVLYTYPELKGVLEKFGDEFVVSVHLLSIQAGVGYHDSGYTLDDRMVITRHVNAHQSMLINHSVVLIDALGCTTISNKVFCAGRYLIPIDHKQKCIHKAAG